MPKWEYGIDGDRFNSGWEHTMDGDYVPKGCTFTLDGDRVLPNGSIVTNRQLELIRDLEIDL